MPYEPPNYSGLNVNGKVHDAYEVLGVSRNASQQEINAAFKKRSKEIRTGTDADTNPQVYLVNAAKDAIGTESKRAEYDLEVRTGRWPSNGHHASAPEEKSTSVPWNDDLTDFTWLWESISSRPPTARRKTPAPETNTQNTDTSRTKSVADEQAHPYTSRRTPPQAYIPYQYSPPPYRSNPRQAYNSGPDYAIRSIITVAVISASLLIGGIFLAAVGSGPSRTPTPTVYATPTYATPTFAAFPSPYLTETPNTLEVEISSWENYPTCAYTLEFGDSYSRLAEKILPEMQKRGYPGTLGQLTDELYQLNIDTFPDKNNIQAGTQITLFACPV